MNTYKERLQKMSVAEIAQAISCVNVIAALTDEQLSKRGLKMEEPQQINHLLNAVSWGQSNLLPEQAATLLRVAPLLLKNGNTTVHRILLAATPKVIDSYTKTTSTEDKMRLGKVLKTAGLVCVDPHLKTAGLDIQLRQRELDMFAPFIGNCREYQDALKRFRAAHRIIGFTGVKGNFGEAVIAQSFKSGASFPRGMDREYEG